MAGSSSSQYSRRVGFYYSSGQPPEEDKSGSWKEIFQIILVVFQVLAVPLAILMAGILYLVFVFWMFSISGWLGVGSLLLIVLAVVARGVWEAKHPPELH